MLEAKSDQIFQFGGFTLDLGKGTLRRGDRSAFLRPKAHAVLTQLARNMGRVVPKSELMDAVWPGVFVTEDSLTQSIREIRKVLGEEMVRTVSKRGYMLASHTDTIPEVGQQPIIAVLRFRNDGGNPEDDAIVDGIADDIVNGLARFGTVTVLARNSSFSFASYSPAEWPLIRSRIGADYLVEGSVRRQGDRILVAVNLVNAAMETQLWGERYEFQDVGLFAVQQEIVEAIVARLVTRVNNAGLQRTMRKPSTSLAAYELVLRGVALLRDPAQSDLGTAQALFEAAICRDPAYGLAHFHLALSKILHAEFGGVSQSVLASARDAAAKGIALSPDQPTGHRVQSLVRLYMRDHEAAEQHLRIALELNPYDAECIGQMGYIMTMRGRSVDALNWLARALRIDPLDRYWNHYDRALTLYLMGDYRGSAETLEMATRPTPWIRTRLAASYAQLGAMADARREMALIRESDADFSPIDYARTGIPFEHAADADHFAEGVLMALGLPPKN